LALLHKQIFDDINTGIITVANDGSITSFNKAAGLITGYRAVEVLGKNIKTQFPEFVEKKLEDGRPVASFTRKSGILLDTVKHAGRQQKQQGLHHAGPE
jgi:PAS domain S-box-containing protein